MLNRMSLFIAMLGTVLGLTTPAFATVVYTHDAGVWHLIGDVEPDASDSACIFQISLATAHVQINIFPKTGIPDYITMTLADPKGTWRPRQTIAVKTLFLGDNVDVSPFFLAATANNNEKITFRDLPLNFLSNFGHANSITLFREDPKETFIDLTGTSELLKGLEDCKMNLINLVAQPAPSNDPTPIGVETKPEANPRSFAYNATDPNIAICSYKTDIPVDLVLAACAALLQKQNQPVVLIHSIRADAYSRNNQPSACVDEENTALSLSPQYEPQHSSDLTKRGACYYDLGDYDHAIDDFTNAIKINPAAIDALYLRGVSNYMKGNYPLAIADYTARLQIRIDSDTLESRGAAYNFTNYYNLAAADLEKSISLNPRSPYSHRHYGVAKGQSHMYDSAIEEFTTAINLDSTYSLAYADRGAAYFDKGDFSRALVDLNQALNIEPKNLDVLYYRGLTYLFLNDAKKAIADLSLVITLKPDFASAFNYRGLSFMGMKGYGAAIEDFKESVRLYPQNVAPHLHLGEAYLAQNNNAAAMVEFNTVIQLKPDDQKFLDEAQHAVDALKAGKPFTPPVREDVLLSLLLK